MANSIETTRYHDIPCESAFRKLGHRIGPYEYDMNIYRGCAHQCAYCYALYSQRYLGEGDFYHDIYIKSNILEHLHRQLASPKWTKQIISIGTVCDSYQPIEAEKKIMRDVLKLFIRYRTPCIISTKSDLILRDMDLIAELAEITYVNIAATITTMNEDLAAIVERGAISPQRRVAMLKQMRQNTKASIGFHDMPMLPYLSDDIFHGKYIDKAYIANIYKQIAPLRKQYGINGNYMKKAHEHFAKQEIEQLSLW